MKTLFTVSIVLCLFLVTSGYHSHKKNPDNDFHIRLPLDHNITYLPADSIFGEKWIVPIETTSACFISNIDKLEIKNDRLYILDDTQDIIFIFDKSGRYITKIADIGRGAEEYLHISDFHIDDNMVYVVAGDNRQIMCYDLQGELLKSFSTEFCSSNITTDSSYLYVYYNYNHPQRYNVGIYNKKDFSLVKCYKTYLKEQQGVGYKNRSWTSHNSQVYVSFHYEYNIYQLTPDTCTVFANFNCGADKMFPKNWNTFSPQDENEYIKNKGGIIDLPIVSSINSLHITSNYLIFTFIYTSLEYTVFFNRSTQNSQYGVLKPDTYYWNIMSKKIYVSDEYIALATSALDIINHRSQVPSAKEEWTLNIKEEDNPCLYFYKLKP